MPKSRKNPPMRKKHVSDSDESFVCEEISPAEVQKRQRTRRQRQHHQITTTDSPLIRRVKTKTRRLDSTLFSVEDSGESEDVEISPAEVQKRQRTRRQRQHHQITTTYSPLIRRVKTKTRRLDSTLFSVKDSGESEDVEISPAEVQKRQRTRRQRQHHQITTTDSPLIRRVKTKTRRLDSTLFSVKDSGESEDVEISPVEVQKRQRTRRQRQHHQITTTDSPLIRKVKTKTRRLDSTLFSVKDSGESEDEKISPATDSPLIRRVKTNTRRLDSTLFSVEDSGESEDDTESDALVEDSDDDEMLMSPETRMSITGIPQQLDSDDSTTSDEENRGEEVCISLSSDEFDEDIFTPVPTKRDAAIQEYPPPPSYPNRYVLDNKIDAEPVDLSDVVRVLTWDELEKGSHAVKPQKFGEYAMRTHTRERTLILERLRDLHSALGTQPSQNQEASAPGTMKTELMPHQKQALAWLRWREEMNPHGGILADDMGLGKTITMIALIAGDRDVPDGGEESEDDETLVKGGTLVVCPPSVKAQWEGELTKHCQSNTLKTATHHGSAKASDPKLLAHMDVVITTYSTLLRGKNGVLTNILWNRLILDEAHVVRNYKNATSRAVCSLHARCRWVLTGTPLHNKDLDLFALLKFLRCTPFDDLTMWKKWIDEKSPGGRQRLSLIMSSIMLRRTKLQLKAKGQLQDLPPRIAHQCFVTLTKEEMSVYQKLLVFSKGLFAQYLELREEEHDDEDSMLHQTSQNDSYIDLVNTMIALEGAKPVVKTHEILVLLLRLRQVCCHCGLIAPMLKKDDTEGLAEDEVKDLPAEMNRLTLEDSNESRNKAKEGMTAAEAMRTVLSPDEPVFQLTRRSSKIQAVMDCLTKNVLSNKDEKAVVVSQWTSVLSLVEQELKQERVKTVTLSGKVPVSARAAVVNKLNDPNSDTRVMLLSLCAGGVGLNLCGASHLLLIDPHWNPQLEAQAQDRVYRVGQTRPVHIYRFMCVETVEQNIRRLQDMKLAMADNVLSGARQVTGSKLTIEDLKLLFNMGPQEHGVLHANQFFMIHAQQRGRSAL